MLRELRPNKKEELDEVGIFVSRCLCEDVLLILNSHAQDSGIIRENFLWRVRWFCLEVGYRLRPFFHNSLLLKLDKIEGTRCLSLLSIFSNYRTWCLLAVVSNDDSRLPDLAPRRTWVRRPIRVSKGKDPNEFFLVSHQNGE